MIDTNPWESYNCLASLNGVSEIPTIDCIGIVFRNLLNVALTLAGAIALIFILIGAFKFVTSRGSPEAVESAKKMITYSLIGLIVIFLAYAIIDFILYLATGRPGELLRITLFNQ